MNNNKDKGQYTMLQEEISTHIFSKIARRVKESVVVCQTALSQNPST